MATLFVIFWPVLDEEVLGAFKLIPSLIQDQVQALQNEVKLGIGNLAQEFQQKVQIQSAG